MHAFSSLLFAAPPARIRASLALAAAALVAACGTSDLPEPTEEFEPAIIGTACSDDVACEPVAQCLSILPGGFCSVACDAATACPGDTLCRTFGDDAWCVPRCRDAGDCRNGYTCASIAADDGTEYQVCDAPPVAAEPSAPAPDTSPEPTDDL